VKVCSEPVYVKVCVAAAAEVAPTLEPSSEKHPIARASARRPNPGVRFLRAWIALLCMNADGF
jgi:hypothetical protein